MFLFLFLLLPFSALQSTICSVNSLDQLKTILNTVNSCDLIAFDIDCTLVIPNDMVLRPCGSDYFLKQCSNIPTAQIQQLISKILLSRLLSPLDADMPDYLRQLQAQTKIIALTSHSPGRLGAINNVEAWRRQELMRAGFDFSSTFSYYQHIVFGDLIHEGVYPVFKDGILFTALLSKAKALQALLGRVKYQPKRIFFIDDSKDQVEALHTALEKHEIESVCIHYNRVEMLNDRFDETIAQQQFDFLRIHEQWLSDSDVRQMDKRAE